MFQIGAELIGDASADADVEMLQLAASLIDEPLVVIDVPSRELTDALSGDPRFSFISEPNQNRGYYTGLRFWVYGADRRTPLAQGGRYDSLYSRFGCDAPAVGFTFTPELS